MVRIMSEYTPDGWVVLKIITPETTLYKVFASWSGGYGGSESWRVNSGITKCYEADGCYNFSGHSGSVYRCSKQGYNRINAYNFGILDRILKNAKDCTGTVMPGDTDWLNMDWS